MKDNDEGGGGGGEGGDEGGGEGNDEDDFGCLRGFDVKQSGRRTNGHL